MQKLYKIIPFVSLCGAVLLFIAWNWNDYNINFTNYEPNLYKSDLNVGGERLFNLRFEYLLKSNLCGNTSKNIFAIFIVTSYFGNVDTRNFMRRAFSNVELEKLNLRRVFLLACERHITISQDSIKDESERFGDIIQGNFREAYRNLTYKHVMGLKWVSQHCTNVKYVIKMDDDTVVDIRQLLKLLKKVRLPSQNYIIGYTMPANPAIRDLSNKWYVSKEEYEDDMYPTFVSGWLYATTPQVAFRLSSIANSQRYFWIDDVFVTGILAQKLNVRFLHINQYFAIDGELMKCCLRESIFPCNYLIGPNEGEVEMFYKFNALTTKCLSKNVCKKHANKKCSVIEAATFSDSESLRGRINTGVPIIIPYKLGNFSIRKHLPNVF